MQKYIGGKKLIFILILVALIAVTGCSAYVKDESVLEMEGFVVEADHERVIVLVGEGISSKEYEDLRDKTSSELRAMNLNDDEPTIIDLSYDNAENFNKGDKVRVWIEDGIDDSDFPEEKAKRISLEDWRSYTIIRSGAVVE